MITNALILLAFGAAAGVIPAALVLYTAKRSSPADLEAKELARRLRASEDRRRELSAELDVLRRQLDEARRTNQYVRSRMYAAEGELRERGEPSVVETLDRIFGDDHYRRPSIAEREAQP